MRGNVTMLLKKTWCFFSKWVIVLWGTLSMAGCTLDFSVPRLTYHIFTIKAVEYQEIDTLVYSFCQKNGYKFLEKDEAPVISDFKVKVDEDYKKTRPKVQYLFFYNKELDTALIYVPEKNRIEFWQCYFSKSLRKRKLIDMLEKTWTEMWEKNNIDYRYETFTRNLAFIGLIDVSYPSVYRNFLDFETDDTPYPYNTLKSYSLIKP